MVTLRHIDPIELGKRVRNARNAASLTQSAFAVALGVARTTVVSVENGTRVLRDAEFLRACEILGVGANALLHRNAELDLMLQFRRAPASRRPHGDAVQATKTLQDLVAAYLQIEEMLGRPLRQDFCPAEVPLSRQGLVEQANDIALTLRQRFGLGIGPIPDVIRFMECELHFRIFERALPSRVSGAYAFDDNAGACIVVNWNHPETRRRWTAAHELGHFLTQRRHAEVLLTEPEDRDAEVFADAFAGALLLPAAALRPRFAEVVDREGAFSLTSLVFLARSFYVSIEAMARRLERLKLLPFGTYDSLKSRGLSKKMVDETVGAENRPQYVLPAPQRFGLLVADAFSRGLVSEGQAATMLGLDRLIVRELIDTIGDEMVIVGAADDKSE